MDDRWQRTRDLFRDVFDLTPEQRSAYLDEACADDAELRAEVEQLIESAAAGDAFLDPPASEEMSILEDRMAAALVGRRVGGFLLRDIIATGGMGIVFLAEQDQPKRSVALKMMKIGFESPESRQRFRFESDMLARLRHPGIAQIHETGVHTEETRTGTRELPWFAMEYIEGARTIRDFANERSLSIEDRLQLFTRVCEAVHHGHQRGVIHRDLKPDNILVESSGQPRIIDFGIARATDSDLGFESGITRPGDVLGTLDSMSPEQIGGDPDAVDARSDVYSLGVVLYELLVGEPPHDLSGRSIHESARVIRDERPRRPGLVRDELDGDLDVILMKPLEKDPAARYASAAALADDIRRYLADEPIHAQTPSMRYHLRMFTRRHRVVVMAAAAILLVSVSAAIISTWQAVIARRAQDAETRARAEGRKLFDGLLDLSTTSVFEFARRLRNLEGTTQVQVDMLQKAVDNLENLHALAQGDLAISTRLAEALIELATVTGSTVFRNLGQVDRARAACVRATGLMIPVLAADPSEANRFLALRARMTLADIEYGADPASAGPLLEEVLSGFEEFEELAPDNTTYGLGAAAVREQLGVLHGIAGDDETALGWFEEAQLGRERLFDLQGEDPNLLHALAVGNSKRGAALLRLDHVDEACEVHAEGLEYAQAAHRLSPDHSTYRSALASDHLALAAALVAAGRDSESEPHFQSGLALLDDMIVTDPEDVRLRNNRAFGTYKLGGMLLKRAELDGDEETWREARQNLLNSRAELEALRASGRLIRPFEDLLADVMEKLEACQDALGEP